MSISRQEFIEYTNNLLEIDLFKDYCPNGLQVSGSDSIKTIISGVSANQALFAQAAACNADLILVHHGLFWYKQPFALTGVMYDRVKKLIVNNISLAAYHLPLDAHKVYGNNILLAKALGCNYVGDLGSVGIQAEFPSSISAVELSNRLATVLNRQPTCFGDNEIKSLGICSGAAQHDFLLAIDNSLDAYITGEVSEFVPAMANESNVCYFAAGHHATEVFGVRALGDHLANKFNLTHKFIDIDNPI